MKAWILEINDHPSLNINLEKEGDKGLIKEVSEIDKYIKVKILGEAIKFMKKKNIDRSSVEKFKGYHKLLPSNEYEGFDSFYQAMRIFNHLVGKKANFITMSKFAKLAKFKNLSHSGFTQT